MNCGNVTIQMYTNRCVMVTGENTMHGINNGLQTLIDKAVFEATEKNTIRVWCGLHQLDLAAQKGYQAISGGNFLEVLRPLISHLRKQYKLRSKMDTQCPQVATTRWLSMSKVLTWLCDHMITIREHLEEHADCAPSTSWWILAFSVREMCNMMAYTLIVLQGHKTLLVQQSAGLESLMKNISDLAGIKKVEDMPEGTDPASIIVKEVDGNSNLYVVKLHIREGIIEHQFHILAMWNILSDDEKDSIITTVGEFALILVTRINDICAQRTTLNKAKRLSNFPVLPSQLLKMQTNIFNNLLLEHEPKMDASGLSAAQVSQEFITFKDDVRRSESLQDAFKDRLTTSDATISQSDTSNAVTEDFDDFWKIIDGKYKSLQNFCAGLATTFANTASVESDFSLIGMEMTDQRSSMTDFTMAAILQTKQYDKLRFPDIRIASSSSDDSQS